MVHFHRCESSLDISKGQENEEENVCSTCARVVGDFNTVNACAFAFAKVKTKFIFLGSDYRTCAIVKKPVYL